MRGRNEQPDWSEVRTGLVLLAAVLTTTLGIFFMDQLRRLVVDGPRLIVAAPEVAELERGSVVWVAGRPMGRVTAIRLMSPGLETEHRVVIEAVLAREAARLIRRDATAEIHPVGMMGEPVVSIRPGSSDASPFDFRDTLVTPALMGRELLLTVLGDLQEAATRARPLAAELARARREGRGTAAALRRDTMLLVSLAADLRRLSRLLQPGPEDGSLGRFAHDDAWRRALERTGARLRELEETGRPAEAAREELAVSVEALGARLDALERELEKGRGTAGRLLHDDELERQAALLQARIDSVRVELLADPLRWLRFRLF